MGVSGTCRAPRGFVLVVFSDVSYRCLVSRVTRCPLDDTYEPVAGRYAEVNAPCGPGPFIEGPQRVLDRFLSPGEAGARDETGTVSPAPDWAEIMARTSATQPILRSVRLPAATAATGPGTAPPRASVGYRTRRGVMYRGLAEDVLGSPLADRYRRKVQLVLTSPPFPLNRKKRYGNRQGEEYVEWLAGFAPLFRELLTGDGSVVVEMGNAWEPGEPAMSTLALEALLRFLKAGDLRLCQQFICHNPARLPSPAQWVSIDRIRVKDSYTHVWWMAATTRPKADNRRVLRPYSPSMLKLLRKRKYNAGRRPSEHRIGATSFLRDNNGAIPSNVLTFTNTLSSDPYLLYCKQRDLPPHPARMPGDLAAFFIKFLTDVRDLVLDPFAGSNVTGATAEALGRRWAAIEPNKSYVEGSRGRFPQTSAE
jgi:hypothetical protein